MQVNSPTSESPQTDHPMVTVVVCTHNRADSLRNALASLSRLTPPAGMSFEILVIDNGSTDETPQVIQAAADNCPVPLRGVLESARGVVNARNRAIVEAFGEWLAFFDDDQLADPEWLAELLRIAIDKNARCVGGAVYLKLPEPKRRLGMFCRRLLSETVSQDKPRTYDHRFNPGAGNLLLHRSLFSEVGNFHADFNDRGEDTMLYLAIRQAGNVCWFTPKAIVHHVIPADRMTDECFLTLTRRLSGRMPAFEKVHWGPWFPLAWLARIGVTACVYFPRLVWALAFGDSDKKLEARVRFLMESNRVRYGIRYLIPGTQRWFAAPLPGQTPYLNRGSKNA